MKKLILTLLLLTGSALAQYPFPTGQPFQLHRIITCGATSCTPGLPDSGSKGFFTANVGYFKLSWTVDGSFTSCAVSLDSNTNRGGTWAVGGVASTGTIGSCASAGAYRNTTAIFNNLTRITPTIVCSSPGCVVTFTLTASLYPFSG